MNKRTVKLLKDFAQVTKVSEEILIGTWKKTNKRSRDVLRKTMIKTLIAAKDLKAKVERRHPKLGRSR